MKKRGEESENNRGKSIEKSGRSQLPVLFYVNAK